jgi:2-polyprenyl-3-methyl-5-hydroxy-6-metoxy-1,4-benzoquinol methylase
LTTKDSYERLWTDAWGDLQRLGPVHRHQREALLRLVRGLQPSSLCDVGCGSGENLLALASLDGVALAGTDISEQALALARQRVPSASFAQLDIQSCALPGTFDIVTAIQVIEHLPDDVAALRNMRRMARRHVVLTTMCGRMRRSEAAIGHVRNYTPEELRSKAQAAGLEVLGLFGWGFPFYTPFYRTAIEWLPGGPPAGGMGAFSRAAAGALYQLYRLNIPRRGEVTTLVARPAGGEARP